MNIWLKRVAFVAALLFLVLTITNASWLASAPKGAPKLIAQRGLAQLVERAGVEPGSCIAAEIEQPYHHYIENTVPAIERAAKFGAHMILVDVAPTADGEIAIFRDRTVECRTEGKGEARSLSMSQLKTLDAGHGYTADGGKTFPFREKGVGAIPRLEEALAVTGRSRMFYNLTGEHAGEADLLVARLKAAGRNLGERGDAFLGAQAQIDRLRELAPGAWALTWEEANSCSRDYVMIGWSGYLPESCRGRTMLVPIDRQWSFWGWPNRLIARMEQYGGRVIVTGPQSNGTPVGLNLPEQLGEIPSTFNGYVWVDDAFTVVPALISRFDNRSQEEYEAAEAAIARRRNR